MSQFLSAQDENTLRHKVGMILFTLEKAIGDSLKEDHPELSAQVAASYFQELLELACRASEGMAKESDFKILQNTILSYKTGDIRNAVSHPNRGLNDHHWFAVAAIASHPVIEKLQLRAVSEALAGAVEGRIAVPPDHWFVKESRALSNTLPKHSEHDITGFIGRAKDLKKLRELLENKRLASIAVVSPGGLGKTALAITVLNDLVHDASIRTWCDAVLYVSAKRQELTADGIKELDVDTTIHNILIQLKTSAEDLACEHHFTNDVQEALTARMIIVCIDNFETVLAEDEGAMEKLNAALPPTVKLLLTSRVPVDGVTTFSLTNLSDGDAIGLAGKYATRVVGTELPNEVKQTLASTLMGSPLAIKLAIDLVNRGHNINAASEKARADVVGFSFTNLIDRLTSTEVQVLELLFLCEAKIGLGDMVGVLDENREELRAAVAVLARTSLVMREHAEGGDLYALNDNIRSLVRTSPRHLQLRHRLENRLRQRRQEITAHESIQKERDISSSDQDYLNPNLPVQLKQVLIQAIRTLKSRKPEAAHKWFQQVEHLGNEYSKYSAFHFFNGRMLQLVGDRTSAMGAYRSAMATEPSHIWARLFFAESLLLAADADHSSEAVSELEAMFPDCTGWPDKPYRRLWQLLYDALERRQDWDKLRGLATLRCLDERVQGKNLHTTYAGYSECKLVRCLHTVDRDKTRDGFNSALARLEDVENLNYFSPHDVRRILFVFKELLHYVEAEEASDFDPEWLHGRLLSVTLISEVLFNREVLVADLYDDCIELLEAFGHLPIGRENPCRHVSWARHVWGVQQCTQELLDDAAAQGMHIARVRSKRSDRGFFIAVAEPFDWTVLCHVDDALGGDVEFRRVCEKDLVVLQLQDDSGDSPRARSWNRVTESEVSRNAS